MCSNKVLLEFDIPNIELKQALFDPCLGYSQVSTGRVADYDTESRFCRHEVVGERESDKSVIGYCTCDPESKMYVLFSLLAQDRCAVLSLMESP